MDRQCVKTRSHVAWLVVAAVLCAAPALAQEFIPPTATTPLEQATDVKAQPLLLLAKFPKAGPGLAHFVAETLAKQPSAVDAMLSILPDTSPEQASAIGAGVVRALRSLMRKEPELIKQITDKVERTENVAFKTTFYAIGPRGSGKVPSFSRIEVSSIVGSNLGVGGTSAPSDKSLIGDGKQDYDSAFNHNPLNKNGDGLDFFNHGMIVAIIASDAPTNGAVPTSPIN